jgi:hypothetical protein
VKIYSFVAQAQQPAHRIDNAAPVAHNPFAVLTTDAPRLQVLQRDAFQRDSQPANTRKPVVSSFVSSLDWINKHSETQLQSRLAGHLAGGSFDDLSQAAGLLNAVSKTNRIQFGAAGSRFDFNRHYSDAVAALGMDDPYSARLSLQRAMRHVEAFKNPQAE